ncbi:MAG: hypothetical protein N3A63_05155 [Bacteroidetes bacterium]|nr:hypothetical protein [Bacteroidota bacterium]
MIFVLTLIYNEVYGVGERVSRGAKPLALANAYTSVAEHPYTLYYNPAGLAVLNSYQFSAWYMPHLYGIDGVRAGGCAGTFSLVPGVFGIGCDFLGCELYRESELSIGGALKIVESVSVGLTLNYLNIQISNYGSTGTISLDAGCLAMVTKELNIGFSVKNLNSATLSHGYEKLPQCVSLGLSYRFPIGFLITLEGEKDLMYPMQVKVGLEQVLLDIVVLRCGIATNPNTYAVGLGVILPWCSVSYGGLKHFIIDWTHLFEVSTIL